MEVIVRQVTVADRKQWAHSVVTEEFLFDLKRSKQEAMEAWAREAFVGVDLPATGQANATALGGVRVLDQLIDMIEEYRQSPEEEIERVK